MRCSGAHRGVLRDRVARNKLVYFEKTYDVRATIAREKEIKKWRREKKNNLVAAVNPDWKDLIRFPLKPWVLRTHLFMGGCTWVRLVGKWGK